MPSDIIQFREDRDTLAFLRGLGVNPNELAREAFDATVRRLRAQAKAQRLARLRVAPFDAAAAVRDARDERASAVERALRGDKA